MIIIIVVIIRHAFCGKLNAFFPASRWQLNHPFMTILEMVFQFIVPFIVSFPIKNGGSFHSYVNVYQRVLLGLTTFLLSPIYPYDYPIQILSGQIIIIH